MNYRDKVVQWNEWLNAGNHKAFEEDIVQMYENIELPLPSEMDICVFQQNPYTHAILDLGAFSMGTSGHGYAKWDHTGKWDPEFGAKTAVKRAARRLFRQLQERVIC